VVSVSSHPPELDPGGDTDSATPSIGQKQEPPSTVKDGAPASSPARPATAQPPRLMAMVLRTLILAIAAILLVYAVLPALLRMV
jgi:hypothetical protein